MSIAPNAKTVDLSADAQIGPLVDGESRSTISAIAHVGHVLAVCLHHSISLRRDVIARLDTSSYLVSFR